MSKVTLNRDQWRIVILSVVAYSVLYFMRLNLSPALAGMEVALQVTPERLGGISSAFFWCYACGQLVFGFLGDRLPTRYMVFTGLFASAVMNMTIGMMTDVTVITVLWGINGIFQSMLWSPIMRCVANNFDSQQRVIVSFYLSITQVVGYIVAWVGSYLLNLYFGWQTVFIVPSVVGILFATIWILMFRDPSAGKISARVEKRGNALIYQPSLLSFLGLISIFSVLFGLVKSSLDTWLPTLIGEVGQLPESAVVITLFFVPLINFAGIMLSKMLVKRLKGDIYKSILLVWGGALSICLISLVIFNFNSVAFVFAISVLFGFVYGLTPLFTSFIPLDFLKWNCVSTITGFVDFAIYVGAGITGIVSGILLGDSGEKDWSTLSRYWFLVLLIGFIIAIGVFFWHHKLRKKISKEGEEWD